MNLTFGYFLEVSCGSLNLKLAAIEGWRGVYYLKHPVF